jgi:hypothetical protein
MSLGTLLLAGVESISLMKGRVGYLGFRVWSLEFVSRRWQCVLQTRDVIELLPPPNKLYFSVVFWSPWKQSGLHIWIWGSHGSKDVDVGLLDCNATWTWWIPTFRRNILTSALKMEAVCSSETLVSGDGTGVLLSCVFLLRHFQT